MNENHVNESLLVLTGELLYNNQLLREAIASRDEVIEQIINHLMIAATSACSCGVAKHLTFVRSVVKDGMSSSRAGKDSASTNTAILSSTRSTGRRIPPWDVAIEAAEK